MEMTLHITIYQYLMGFVERWNNNIFHIQLWSLQLRSSSFDWVPLLMLNMLLVLSHGYRKIMADSS